MKNPLKLTLAELLNSKNGTIKRHAKGISNEITRIGVDKLTENMGEYKQKVVNKNTKK